MKSYSKIRTGIVCIALCAFSISGFHSFPVSAKENPNISADYAESSLFDNTKVHTINLLISDENWNDLIVNALDEKYVTADVEIDGELIKNIAIRTKDNSSLKAVQRAGSEHFSFKIEFDHNDDTTTYHGLDKLSLNNLGQDISCMKDFMSYTMFNDMEVAAPLSSYSVLQKNGKDFGLYLSVEAIEDSFRVRNYGNDNVDLYKPEIFDLNKLATDGMTDRQQLLQTISGEWYKDKGKGDRLDILYDLWGYVFTPEFAAVPSLKYIGDNQEDYSALWDSSVFKCTDEDKQSYIDSVKVLNSKDGLSVIDTDSVIRYMVVHNFVNNTDSHSTMFCHNFYICNHDGKLSYVPWDYNAAFGGFNFENIINSIFGDGFVIDMRPDLSNAMNTDVSFVNYPIDTPYYSISPEDRPVFNAILTDEDCLKEYHNVFQLLIQKFENGDYDELWQTAYQNIEPYAEKGLIPYDYTDWDKAAADMHLYLNYRAESISGQLNGSIPATLEGQSENPDILIQPKGLSTDDMVTAQGLIAVPDTQLMNDVLTAAMGDKYEYTGKGLAQFISDLKAKPLSFIGRVPALMKVKYIRDKAMPFMIGAAAILAILIAIPIVIIKKKKKAKALALQSSTESTDDTA